MSIEKDLFPEANKLKIKNGIAEALIVDEELDPVQCTFDNGGCVILHIADYTHIALTERHLNKLIDLLRKATHYYNRDDKST